MRKIFLTVLLSLLGAAAFLFLPIGWMVALGGIEAFEELGRLTGWEWLDRWHYWGAAFTWFLVATVFFLGWFILYRKRESTT